MCEVALEDQANQVSSDDEPDPKKHCGLDLEELKRMNKGPMSTFDSSQVCKMMYVEPVTDEESVYSDEFVSFYFVRVYLKLY